MEFDASADEVLFNAYDIGMQDGDLINWGDSDDFGANWDRAYMTFNAGVKWMIGRQTGGAFGTLLFDNEGDADRIKAYFPLGENFTLIPIYQR